MFYFEDATTKPKPEQDDDSLVFLDGTAQQDYFDKEPSPQPPANFFQRLVALLHRHNSTP